MGDTEKLPPNLRLMRIVEILAKNGKPMTPTEINAELKLPKQSLHRLCTMMIEQGYLDKSGRKVMPSSRLISMASGLSRIGTDTISCHQILKNVSNRFGETVNLVRPEKEGMNYIDRVETNWPFRILLPIGTHVPFHCTASGKTFLASLAAPKRRALIAALPLSQLTPFTLNNSEELEKELVTVKTQKFAIDNEEFHEGMVAVAVPICDNHRKYFGALAVHGPNTRFNIDEAVLKIDILKQAAAEIEHVLFGS